jgi:curved DNA-binding protein CbpA
MDFYALLGIDKSATDEDIKRAYGQKIRQFPPDQFPDEFKQIRQAYETLNDPKSRNEYDTMSEHGKEIEQHLEAGLAAVEDEDYPLAIQHYKKILWIEPKLNNVRNYFALALSYNGQNEKSLAQFQRLVQSDPGNSLYHFNMGTVLADLERYDEAVMCLRQSYRLDSGNVNIIFYLADLLHRLKRTEEARHSIRDAIKDREDYDFARFVYLFKLLQLEVYEKNAEGIEKALEQIEKLLALHPEEKRYAADRYAKFAFELLEYKLFKWAMFLTERAKDLDPDNEAIRKLHETTAENKPIYEEYELMKEDTDISEWVKNFYIIYLYGDEVSEEELKTYNEKAFDNLYQAAKYASDEVIHSIRKMIVSYPHLYDQRKEWLQKFMEIGKDYKEIDKQYNLLKNDTSMVNSLKRLVALLLAENISQEESSHYFEDIMGEMSHEYTNDIARSLTRLKQVYPKLYQVNTKLFDDFFSEANARAPSGSGHTPRSTSSGSGSSCFVATAAYGSPLAEELDVLRLWRDKVLRTRTMGRRFIAIYYRIGPAFAKLVDRSDALKLSVRFVVYQILKRLESKYDLSTMERKPSGGGKRN